MKLTLAKGVCTYSPPSSVRLIVLELSRQEDSNQDLEDTSLHHDDSDYPKHSMRRVPKFEEPL
jgi:hypothetical protein